MKKTILFFISWLISLAINAQEMSGIVNGNYSGVNGYAINPSLASDSKLYMDINFLTAGVSYQTNWKNNGYGNFRLNAPSFMLNRGENAYAFLLAARTAVSYKKTSNNGGKYDEYQIAGVAWGEVGLSYAKVVSRVEKHWWAVGFTAKYLMGAGGSYFVSTSLPTTGSNNASTNLSNSGISGGGGFGFGKGFGLDLGLTYQKKEKMTGYIPFKKLCQQKFQPYKYKLGFSIIDFGFLKYGSKTSNSKFNQYINPNRDTIIVINNDTIRVDSLNNSQNSSLYKSSYAVYLPAGFCIQLDYHVSEHWYINGLFVKGMNLSPEFVRRPTLIMITPRYEKRWFEANFPMGISDMKYFKMGVAVRFWNFTIGTDNILGSIGAGANKSFDVYLSLRMNFQKGKCERSGEGILGPFKQLFK